MDVQTGSVTIFTAPGLSGPGKVLADSAGNHFVVESAQIQRIDADTGAVTLIAGGPNAVYPGDGGPAVNAQIVSMAAAINAAGDLFLGDGYRVRKIDHATQIIQTIAGNGALGYTGDGGPASLAEIGDCSSAITVDAVGNLYLVDRSYFVVRKIDAVTQTITTFAGSPTGIYALDCALANQFQLNWSGGLAIAISFTWRPTPPAAFTRSILQARLFPSIGPVALALRPFLTSRS